MKPWSLLVLGSALLGCATGQGRGKPAVPVCNCPCAVAGATAGSATPSGALSPTHADAAVPVTSADPSWGNADAPVTLVMWSDFECPFCSRVGETLAALKRAYGPAQLRLVWKNYPLSFHAHARPAAEAAMAVFALGGADAFWKFHDLAFADQQHLSLANYVAWAAAAGVDPGGVEAAVKTGQQKSKIDADVALANRLAVRGTPAFRINGVALVGAQPEGSFRAIIDAQLAAAKALVAGGTAAAAVYPTLCAQNVSPTEVVPTPEPQAGGIDTKVWSVQVDRDDPVRGPGDALVTLVLWSDFECPFCRRLAGTLAELGKRYESDLRIVWKDYPLPFHPQAVPAAVLARLAAAKRGAEGFWEAHDAILASDGALDEAALRSVAVRLRLPWSEVQAALADHRFQAIFERSQSLAKQLAVRGTPCSFINGRRLEGALPAEAFAGVIEAELAKARDRLEAGQPRAGLYAAITNTAEPYAELERRTVAAPGKDNPSRGSAKAPVTMQIFGDFQCPETLRTLPKLEELEKKFGNRVRLVWRNHPLAFHEDAPLAAEAALEVFAQKGASAFWRYHAALFAAQKEGGLGRDNLEKLARRQGVDGKRFRAALEGHKHRAEVERDLEAAAQAELTEVPTVVINGYLVAGVEPYEVYDRAVQQALADLTAPR
jgi:protein-disulfide isomerase